MSTDDKAAKARILLGVWGESFIRNFLEYSLPSLLAPGNIPALSSALPTTFVFLTRPTDVDVFEESALIQQLKNYCQVEYVSIKDLIANGNYSTTLTYAFDRAIQQTGAEMLDTYFIFLTSDYIMADGSMLGLLRYINKGYSGICAGNFQTIKEEIAPLLEKHIDANGIMSIKPRELVQYSLPYLHPITIASMLNQNVLHNYRANRFFISDNAEAIAGRFYLLHMLCIKPEKTDYRFGASCDYSFIPEMCPSGNIAIIDDSDDYFVIEAQPKEHELDNLAWGKYKQKELITALAEWTTARHRKNSETTIYYHSADLTIAEKQRLDHKIAVEINAINTQLAKYPAQSTQDHPYWQGATVAFDDLRVMLESSEDYEFVNYIGIQPFTRARKFYFKIFGMPPSVFPWHYRWLEYQRVTNELLQKLPQQSDRLLVLYSSYQADFMNYRNWFANNCKHAANYFLPVWKQAKKKRRLPDTKYDTCLLMLKLSDMSKLRELLSELQSTLSPNAQIILFIPNEYRAISNLAYNFVGEFSARMNNLINLPFKIKDVVTINSNQSLFGASGVNYIKQRYSFSRKKRLWYYAFLTLPAVLYIFTANIFSRLFIKNSHVTNIIATLTSQQEVA